MPENFYVNRILKDLVHRRYQPHDIKIIMNIIEAFAKNWLGRVVLNDAFCL